MKGSAVAVATAAAALVGLAVVSVFGANDAGSAITLDWVAPKECATQADVRARIARLLEGSSKPARALTITARVDHRGGIWRVTLRTEQDQRTGEREIRAESCDALADAAALVVAISIDPEVALQNQSATSSDAGATDAAPASSSGEVTPAAAPTRVKPAPRVERSGPSPKAHRQILEKPRTRPWAVGVAADADFGRLPGPAFGESVFVAREVERLRFELGAELFWPKDAEVREHPAAGGRFRLVAGRARGCYRFDQPSLGVAACGGADLSWISAHGLGVRTPTTGDAFWVSPALGFELFTPISERISIVLAADAMLSIGRRPFEIDGVLVHEPGRVTGAAYLGEEVHF